MAYLYGYKKNNYNAHNANVKPKYINKSCIY